MKIRLLLAACALTTLLGACSTTGNTLASAPSYNDGYDHAYMNRVEKAAQATGTQIIWINPPKAKTSDGRHD